MEGAQQDLGENPWASLEARYVAILAPSVVASQAMVTAMEQEDRQTPNRLASFVCDVAAAIVREETRRGWLRPRVA